MRVGATSPLFANSAGLRAAVRRELRIGDRGSLRAHLIRGAGGSLALKVVSALLSLVVGVLLARALGANQYGIYALALAWLGLLKVPTTLGLPALVTREVAAYSARQDWARLRGLLVRANQVVVGMSFLLILLAGGASWLLARWFEGPQAFATFWLALLLLPLSGLAALRAACFRGLHQVVLGQIPEALVRPVVFLVLITAAWLPGSRPLTPELAMALQVVAVGVTFLVGAAWLLRRLPREAKSAAPTYDTRTWAISSLPFLVLGGLNLINAQTDIIMLGWFGTTGDVGVYRVAGIGASLSVFALGAANAVLGPTITRLHAEGDMRRLQHLATRSARAILLLSLPATMPLVFFGGPILSTVFGSGYAVGATALAILALGQLLNAGMGSVAALLTMTGNERDTAKGVGLAALFNVALNAFLIPLWGISGAALASVLSLGLWNVLLAAVVHRRLGLHTTALGPLHFRRTVPADPEIP